MTIYANNITTTEGRFLKMETQNNVDVVVTENASYETLSHRRAIFYVNKNNVDKEFFVLIDEGYGADNGKKYKFKFQPLPRN